MTTTSCNKNKKVSLSSESELVPCLFSLSWSSLTPVTLNQPLGLSVCAVATHMEIDRQPTTITRLVVGSSFVKSVNQHFWKLCLSSVKRVVFRKIGTCLKAHSAVINTMVLMEWRGKYPVWRCVKVCKVCKVPLSESCLEYNCFLTQSNCSPC